MGIRFNEIVTHEKPHLDEIATIWLLKRRGETKYPGVKDARILFWQSGNMSAKLSPQKYEEMGILLVGIGGGRFDEHPANGTERKKDECAATLVAKDLGISDDPSLSKIQRYVLNNDTKGTSHPFDLAETVKLLHGKYPNNSAKVVELVMEILDAYHYEQMMFFSEARKDFETKGKVESIKGPKGKTLKMLTIVSDNEQINKYSRFVGDIAVVIQKTSAGNVQIFTNQQYALKLYDVVKAIRRAEQEANGKIVTSEWKQLSAEGRVAGAEAWWFHEPCQMLLNGSLTAPEVPPTKLSLEQIAGFVKMGIDPEAFEPKHAAMCKQGKCVMPCPWKAYGFIRCSEVRSKMKLAESAKKDAPKTAAANSSNA
ncbi:MAG: hypothetical protein PHN74_01505 [Candidatus Pacebacteria bacterium]|nr:hypothetical protein [Candidatus Paceibacterota bacterium]